MSKCKNGCDFHYYPATNEDGWRCIYCDHHPGEPPGFSPQLDRELIGLKVGAILHDACNAHLISVSNGSDGDCLSALIADKCVRADRFDQYSILFYLLAEMTPSHAEHWREVSDGIIAGANKRNRCHCGKLATLHIGGQGDYCSMAHAPKEEMLF